VEHPIQVEGLKKKGEKIPARKKAWVLAVLVPLLLIGGYRVIYRNLERSGAFLIRNARIFTATGKTIENGSVLVRGGKIAAIYEGAAPDAETLKATVIEGRGKTLLPGLIDAHVHLAAMGGALAEGAKYDARDAMRRAAAALLYSGVTSARSMGDPAGLSLKLRKEIASGATLWAQLFVCGPVFAVDNRGAEFLRGAPAAIRDNLVPQLIRTPKTPEDARKQVRELKAAGVDGIKAVVEADFEGQILADRQDLLLARSMAEEARAQKLPLAAHTGGAADVADAVEIGATSIEHGAWLDELPDSLLERMAARGVYYDPALSAAEAFAKYYAGDAELLKNPLVEQSAPEAVLNSTRQLLASGKSADPAKAALFQHAFEQAGANLLRAWKAGVPLAMGTDAGSPLVFHGASLHHELQLWVAAGIPAEVALEAATVNVAKLLRAGNRIGAIRKGLDADLLLVDGNPLTNIAATERISLVVLKGERIHRQELTRRGRE
jgi:imidazolonepropionase-like amidohydrolase